MMANLSGGSRLFLPILSKGRAILGFHTPNGHPGSQVSVTILPPDPSSASPSATGENKYVQSKRLIAPRVISARRKIGRQTFQIQLCERVHSLFGLISSIDVHCVFPLRGERFEVKLHQLVHVVLLLRFETLVT